MNISSAYIFAKQIKGATPQLPANVIYDSGRFNAQRMKQGFSLSNVLTAQSVYSGVSYSNGIRAIEGYFTQYVEAADGKTFESIGTSGSGIEDTGQYLEHIGTSATDDDVDGCAIFLPVEMNSLREEGYSTLNILFDWSTDGITDPSQLNEGILHAYAKKTENYQLFDIGGGAISLEKTSTLTEFEFSVNLGGSGLNWVPTYIEIRVTHGTYHIKKIWFE